MVEAVRFSVFSYVQNFNLHVQYDVKIQSRSGHWKHLNHSHGGCDAPIAQEVKLDMWRNDKFYWAGQIIKQQDDNQDFSDKRYTNTVYQQILTYHPVTKNLRTRLTGC